MDTDIKQHDTLPILRRSRQPLMPRQLANRSPEGYTPYPAQHLSDGLIHSGYSDLASWIAGHQVVAIDGYQGVFFDEVREQIDAQLQQAGLGATWIDTTTYLKPESEISALVAPYTGEPGSPWGTRTLLTLSDFFELPPAGEMGVQPGLTIFIGPGAALFSESAALIYIDLPKNELQLRMRAGAAGNLGTSAGTEHAETYKRFYFVDWVVLNAHKKVVLSRAAIIADGQWPGHLHWMYGADMQQALATAASSVFRVRPWFEPGAWGGQWMKQHLTGLTPDEVNYAWSFELIVPENGLVFESSGRLLEVSFDCLMFSQRDAVLGDFAATFGDEFPIRFDFLDTWDGGNLSIQCHPTLPYIQKHFGERLTQDETYYIMDCQDDAAVYLGFQEGIDPQRFRRELEESQDTGKTVEIFEFVQTFQARKHDLFLIPNGTVHSAGKGNLVLEISATPYIFTFKMYDWVRLDLNGKPRPINIAHAFNNLDFSRQGDRVARELVAHPEQIAAGEEWKIISLPTHAAHFYGVNRLEFSNRLEQHTNGSPHVCMLVEGDSVLLVLPDGGVRAYHYAETFVVPAATGSYTLSSPGGRPAKVVQAYLKPNQK